MPRKLHTEAEEAEPVARTLPAQGELEWTNPIHLAFKADWSTPEILLEGSLASAKTTLALDKEIDALLKWPGIPILLFRWTQDAVSTKLKTAFEEILTIRGVTWDWENKQNVYRFDNGSMAFMFGLKAVSDIEQFNKIRGLSVSRVMGDQVEEMRRSVAGELRARLRPDLTASMMGTRYPFQLTFVANPDDSDFWLSKEFPLDNRIKGRKVYSLSVFDNPKLPQETIDGLIRTYPPDHPKHQTMVLGQRGPNITGDPVFEGLYRKDLHWREVGFRSSPILEAFQFGKHNPTWVFAQAMYGTGISVLGGIRAEGLMLEDFLTIVAGYRDEWYPKFAAVKSCVAPIGDQQKSTRYTPLDVLRKHLKIRPQSRPNGNSADVRLAMIETLASYLRRRNANGEEAFAINHDDAKFLIANKEGVRESAFMHHAFEGGAVWDEHFVSVGNKEVRQVREDDKFSNALHCVEDICLNFCASQLTEEERHAKEMRQHRDRGPREAPLQGEGAWAI